MIALKSILVPTDFSDASAGPMKYALALAEAFGARLHILHVLDNALAAWEAEGLIEPPADYFRTIEESARKRMSQVLTESQKAAFKVHIELRTGSPYAEIVQYADEQHIDLIVMGTHGRGGVAHMLLGSVAEKVVRKAPCPVLTVRAGEQTSADRGEPA
jgi:nucleotide-binding universal stress UspA family protein